MSHIDPSIGLQIFQGLVPSVTAAFSDSFGRRPAYIACLAINLAANLGLAVQNSYTSLLVLRCVQSAGSGGTVALAQAVLDDMTTSEQRGKFLAYLSIGFIIGPALGPVRLTTASPSHVLPRTG